MAYLKLQFFFDSGSNFRCVFCLFTSFAFVIYTPHCWCADEFCHFSSVHTYTYIYNINFCKHNEFFFRVSKTSQQHSHLTRCTLWLFPERFVSFPISVPSAWFLVSMFDFILLKLSTGIIHLFVWIIGREGQFRSNSILDAPRLCLFYNFFALLLFRVIVSYSCQRSAILV